MSAVVSAEASCDGECTRVFVPSSTPDVTASLGRAGEIAPHPIVAEDGVKD